MKKKSADSVLSENLRREMGKRHLSDTDMAHRSGLSVSTLQTLLNAAGEERESASLARVQRVAEALGMDLPELLAEKDQPAPANTRSVARSTDDTPKQLGQLIEDFFALPEADRRVLLGTATEMASKYRQYISR
ncbi:MAG: hypothetical protein JWN73_4329 [Betaproteobacteria bacterium]|nr:hypothetical protein [Betaproteobacteria bacterium]